MRKFRILLLLICILNFTLTIAQSSKSDCACCSETHSQFDFWIGEWEVFDTNGKIVGTNTITKQYDNCLLQEKWISAGPNRGTSYNYYDKTDGSWHQLWIDNTGYVLKLKGKLIDHKMVLKSDIIQNDTQNFYNQISWFENKDNTITQLWETYDENHKKINELFRGIYKKKLN